MPIFCRIFSATVHHSYFKLGTILRLRVLHVAYRIQVHQLSTSCFTTSFIFPHSIRNQYFLSHFSHQPCITATSNSVNCFGYGFYASVTEFRSTNYLLPVLRLRLFSDILFVTNIFCRTFLSNHASQPL